MKKRVFSAAEKEYIRQVQKIGYENLEAYIQELSVKMKIVYMALYREEENFEYCNFSLAEYYRNGNRLMIFWEVERTVDEIMREKIIQDLSDDLYYIENFGLRLREAWQGISRDIE